MQKIHWVYKNVSSWTMTPSSVSNNVGMYLDSRGHVNGTYIHTPLNIEPTLYLKPNVKILNDGQDGSLNQPYHLQQVL